MLPHAPPNLVTLAARPLFRTNHIPFFISAPSSPVTFPLSPSWLHHYCHHQNTMKWSGCLCRWGLSADKTWLDICWKRGGSCCVNACAWWRSWREGDKNRERYGSMKERRFQRKTSKGKRMVEWKQREGDSNLLVCFYRRYQITWHVSKATPLQWSVGISSCTCKHTHTDAD